MTKPSQTLQNAIALAYQAGDAAPKVVAKGKGLIAEEIIARAKEHGVYIHQSKELVSLLMKVELDHNIPPALYRVVAELLAWLYHIENEKSGSANQQQNTKPLI
jgi:flagellar biosynthesis protein